MHRSDENVESTIISCMKEHDVKDVEVMQSSNHETIGDKITVIKKLGDKKLGYSFEIPETSIDERSRQKEITLQAEKAAVKFNQEIRTAFKWNDVKADVSMYDGGWAKCKYCGTEVEFPPPKMSKLFSQDAELSTPHPTPKEPDSYVSDMDGHQKVLLRMYLIGRMKQQCDLMCQDRYSDEPKPLSI